MSVVNKKLEQVITTDVSVVVCDSCGREALPDPKDNGWVGHAPIPKDWYLVARASGNRKEACCQSCAIAVIKALTPTHLVAV